MTAAFLVDTNILVYAASKAAEDQCKREVARYILRRADIAFSAQVLQEFYAVAAVKARLRMTHADALEVLRSLAEFPVHPTSRELVLEAAEMSHRHKISYWDAAILAAARQLNCHSVYSEDLNAGQTYDGVTVVNPFIAT